MQGSRGEGSRCSGEALNRGFQVHQRTPQSERTPQSGRTPQSERKHLQIKSSDKGLISRTDKELLQHRNEKKEKQTTRIENGRRTQTDAAPRETRRQPTCTRKAPGSAPLAVRDARVEAATGPHFVRVGAASVRLGKQKPKRTNKQNPSTNRKTPSVGEDVATPLAAGT